LERKSIVIVGPTCSGKTALSLILAKKLNSEIISADSRQIFKQLNIGTAKPKPSQLREIKHHYIDFLEPHKEYNVSSYENDALNVIERLIEKEKIPIVVGGSGLYIKSLVDGIFDTVDRDIEYRKKLMDYKKNFGNDYLHNLLKQVDPESASQMLPQNWKRVVRALEVFKITNRSIRQLQQEHKREKNIEFFQFGLQWDRKILYQNIGKRVDEMLVEGLIDETKNILKMGLNLESNSLNTVGYKEIISFINDEISLDKAIELIKRNTRRYAKRQMTWFNKDKRIKWIDMSNKVDLEKASDLIINEVT
jgi:tRNA dimethylallyltransferase